MNQLFLGGRVRVKTTAAAFNCRVGRIIHITEPFVANNNMRSEALERMPLYEVQLDDGKHTRCRGVDLEIDSSGIPAL
jgi:hypothetical protein